MDQSKDQNCAFTLVWQIENVSYCAERNGESLDSPSFTVLSLNRTGFHLSVFPRGKEEGDEHIRVRLRKNRSAEDTYRDAIDWECSFLGVHESSLFTSTVRNQLCPKTTGLDLPHCPTQKEVFFTKKPSFLPQDTLTIRCRLWRSNGGVESSGRCFARTRIAVQKISIVWPIRSFNTLPLNQCSSTPLELFPERLESYTIRFSLAGSNLSSSRARVVIDADTLKRVTLATCKISILNSRGKARKWTIAKHWFTETGNGRTWNFPNLFTRQELVDKQARYLPGDVLTLLLEYEVSAKGSNLVDYTCCRLENWKEEFIIDHIFSSQRQMSRDQQPSEDQQGSKPNHLAVDAQTRNSASLLRDDLLSLYRDHTLSDFKLRSGDVSFPVHKNVLSARSPVFRAMFSRDVKESKLLVIPDLDAHTLNRMLTFLYTGTVDDLQWERAVKLYYAAVKYQVLSLKQECSTVLMSNIGVANVCDILVVAHKHQDDQLKSFVCDFILKHYDEVVISEEWDKFLESDTNLAGKTMQQVYKKRLQVTKTSKAIQNIGPQS